MALEIGQGVAAGLITHKAAQHLDHLTKQGPSHEESVVKLLTQIRDALSPKDDAANVEDIFALQPYPYEYPIDEEWHTKPHVCIFFHDSTPIRFDIEGVGTYQKTVGPGWVQCDVRGRLSTTDSQSHNIIVSYREDALGAAL